MRSASLGIARQTTLSFGKALLLAGFLPSLAGLLFAQTVYSTDTEISSDTAVPGFSISDSAIVTVTNDAVLTYTVTSYVGGNSTTGSEGSLAITDGGHVSRSGNVTVFVGLASGSTGSVLVDGAGSLLENYSGYIGGNGTGSLIVSDGGTFAYASQLVVGYGASGSGSITVTGPGSAMTAVGSTILNVGYNGTGSLVVSDGGFLSVGITARLGVGSGSTGNATVASGGSIQVGNTGTGTLTVGSGSGSTATLNIGAAAADPASAAGFLNVGTVSRGSGDGTLQFNTTGTVSAPTYFTKDGSATGANISTSGALKLVNTAGYTVFNGALAHTGTTTLDGGTAIFNGTVSGSAVTVNGGATLGGSGSFNQLVTFNDGSVLAPGNSAGTITFANGLTLNDGSALDFKLGTTSDLIVVAGGTLTGSASTGGITLNIFDAGGLDLDTYMLFDFSGAGGVADFDLTRFTFGNTVPGYDYALQLDATSLSLVVTASPVPEPATYAALAGIAVLGFAALRRRRR